MSDKKTVRSTLDPNVKWARDVYAAVTAYLVHADDNGKPEGKRAQNALAKLQDLCSNKVGP